MGRLVTPLALCSTLALGGLAFGQGHNHDHDHDHPHAGEPQQGSQVEAPPVDPESPPRLELERQKHDFGRIPDTDQVSTGFRFRNAGTGELIITNIRSSCGCTVPQLEKTEYAPGESGEITVNFNPRNRTGEQHRTVTVFSNDPENPSTELVIDAFVRKLVEVTPAMVRMGKVPFGESHSVLVDITLRDPAMELVDASISRGQGITLDRLPGEEAVEQGEEVKRETLMIHLSDDAPIGAIQGAVALTLEDGEGEQRVQNLSIIGEVIGDILLAPAAMNVGIIEPGEAVTRHIRASSRNERPFKILRVEERPLPGLNGEPRDPQIEDIEFELIAPDDGKGDRYMMKLSFRPRAEVTRQFYTELAAITDRKDQPEIPIRILGRIQSEAGATPAGVGPAGRAPGAPAAPAEAPQGEAPQAETPQGDG